MNISIELVSAVLGGECENIVMTTELELILDRNGWEIRFNIYQFAHMIKEWAYDNGYKINITINSYAGHGDIDYLVTVYDSDNIELYDYSSSVIGEPNLVFKAGEWILKNVEA